MVSIKITNTEPEDLNKSFVRFVKNGIVMNLQSAKSIYNWLGGLIEQCEKAQNAKN